jgi:putative sugar O-methyltransferase
LSFGRVGRALALLFTHPAAAYRRALAAAARARVGKRYVAAEPYRSESEDGDYPAAVERALSSEKEFATFKQNLDYQLVLEHVSREQGADYLALLEKDAPDLLARIDDFRRNDWIGSPTVFAYPGIGTVSPTTLRYMKVASDLRRLFGSLDGAEVVEIGGGYGGQLLVADQLFALRLYTIFDLPPVLRLIRKYIESHLLRGSFATSTLNEADGTKAYDLVISNYAFSELPDVVQLAYLRKVISKSQAGYMTMNSGVGISRRDRNKLSLDQLKVHLPPCEIFEERPLTEAGNYILAWGHSGRLD